MFGLYSESTVHQNGTESNFYWHTEGKDEKNINEKMELFMDNTYGKESVSEGEGVEKVYDLDNYRVSICLEHFFETKEELMEELFNNTKA